jgi:hypothetical protein
MPKYIKYKKNLQFSVFCNKMLLIVKKTSQMMNLIKVIYPIKKLCFLFLFHEYCVRR